MWKWIPYTVVMQPAGTTTPPPAPAQAITSFTANPTSIQQGQTAKVSWATANASAVRLNGVAAPLNAVDIVVNPSVTTVYTLEVDGSAPTTKQSLTITVALQPPVDSGTPQGTVSLVGTNTLSNIDPDPQRLNPECGSMGHAGTISNGSHAFAPNFGTQGGIVLCGGGHFDSGLNHVCGFDFALNKWVLLSTPSASATATNDPAIDWTRGELPDKSPMACHGFNILTVIPGGANGKGLLLRVAAPSLGVGPGGPSAPYAHAADLGLAPGAAPTAIWSRFSTNACMYLTGRSVPVPYFHTYDEQAKVCWGGYAGGAFSALTKLDLTTRTYTDYPNVASSIWGYMPQACAHPVRGLMLWIAGYGNYGAPQTPILNALDLSNPLAGRIQLKVQGDTIPISKVSVQGGYPSPWGFDWDTTNDAGYVCSGDEDPTHLYRIQAPAANPLTDPWTITKITIPALPLLYPYDAVYGQWRYCKGVQAFSYITTTKQKLALWRPK